MKTLVASERIRDTRQSSGEMKMSCVHDSIVGYISISICQSCTTNTRYFKKKLLKITIELGSG